MFVLRGRVFERVANGGIGRGVSGVTLTFVGGRDRHQVETGRNGTYRIELEPGRYRVRAEHPDYDVYTSGREFLVLRMSGSVANFFLTPSVRSRQPETSVFRGRVFERLPDGSIGAALPETVIGFIPEGSSDARTVTSDGGGSYSIELPLGRYVVTSAKEGYESFSSEPGFFVLRAGPTVANLFLEPASPTTEPDRFVFRGDRKFNSRTTL